RPKAWSSLSAWSKHWLFGPRPAPRASPSARWVSAAQRVIWRVTEGPRGVLSEGVDAAPEVVAAGVAEEGLEVATRHAAKSSGPSQRRACMGGCDAGDGLRVHASWITSLPKWRAASKCSKASRA